MCCVQEDLSGLQEWSSDLTTGVSVGLLGRQAGHFQWQPLSRLPGDPCGLLSLQELVPLYALRHRVTQ